MKQQLAQKIMTDALESVRLLGGKPILLVGGPGLTYSHEIGNNVKVEIMEFPPEKPLRPEIVLQLSETMKNMLKEQENRLNPPAAAKKDWGLPQFLGFGLMVLLMALAVLGAWYYYYTKGQ